MSVEDAPQTKHMGDVIRRRREELGLTQQQAAARADIALSTWGQYEGGRTEGRGLTRAAIARALGWRADAMELILAGGDPVADPQLYVSPTDRRDHPPAAEPALQGKIDQLSPADRKYVEELVDRLLGQVR